MSVCFVLLLSFAVVRSFFRRILRQARLQIKVGAITNLNEETNKKKMKREFKQKAAVYYNTTAARTLSCSTTGFF